MNSNSVPSSRYDLIAPHRRHRPIQIVFQCSETEPVHSCPVWSPAHLHAYAQLIKKLGRISKARLASALSGLLPSAVVCVSSFVIRRTGTFPHILSFLFMVKLFRLQSTPAKKSLSPSTGKDSAATAAASTALSLSPIIQAKTVAADAKHGKAEFSQFTPSPRVARASSSLSASSKAVGLNKSSAAKQHTAPAHAANKSQPTPAAAFVASAERESSERESPSAIDSLQIEASPSAPQLGDAPSADCFEHGFEHRTVASAASSVSASADAPTAFVSLLDRPAARASVPMSAAPSFEYAPAPAPASASASLIYPTASASAWPMVAPFQQQQQQQQEQNMQANADIAEMLHRLNQRMEEVREHIMLGSSHMLALYQYIFSFTASPQFKSCSTCKKFCAFASVQMSLKSTHDDSFRARAVASMQNFNEQLRLMAEQVDALSLENTQLKSRVRASLN
jgi:hypothetical protein